METYASGYISKKRSVSLIDLELTRAEVMRARVRDKDGIAKKRVEQSFSLYHFRRIEQGSVKKSLEREHISASMTSSSPFLQEFVNCQVAEQEYDQKQFFCAPAHFGKISSKDIASEVPNNPNLSSANERLLIGMTVSFQQEEQLPQHQSRCYTGFGSRFFALRSLLF